ncbi:hypothetical protein SteCoe_33607 [Stentor coeruleus]|uniref:RCC1-like domain-containing protein n=1 Tax=Stentor coeruleus TaxID=5963 RepID=A0A1R2AWI4_9CILI|nr:hypothetical protein SteCoe_33607 [Stentor coeruleus]
MMEGYTEVFAWGADHFGQLGLGNKYSGKTYASPRFCSFNILIKEIACGEEHSAFIAISGHVYSMGSNSDGRLGLGDKSLRQSSSPCLVEGLMNYKCVRISCGWGHTAVVTEEGSVFSWGVGEFGALGNGCSENAWSPTKAVFPRTMRGLDISCGSRHTGLIAEENRNKILLMTGSGEAGQLGTGKREKEFSYVIVNFTEDLQAVSCGVFHTLLLNSSGKVYAMGGNSFGQLGLGNKKSSSKPEKVQLEAYIIKIVCGSHSAAISDKGQLYVWGTGVFGEYLQPTRLNIPACKDVSIGGSYGIAVDISGNVFAWGANSNGELGVGDYDPRIVPTNIQSLKGKTVKKVSSGGNYAIALGLDLISESRYETSILEEIDNKKGKKDDIFFRTEDKIRNEKFRGSSMEVDKRRYSEAESRVKEIEKNKISERENRNKDLDRTRYSELEVRPVERKINEMSRRENERFRAKDSDLEYKTKENEKLSNNYRQIASRYEDTKLELTRMTEKTTQYKFEIQRFEREIEELKRTNEYNIKDLQFSNNNLKQAIEEYQKQNNALSQELKGCREETQKYKRMLEEVKQSSRIEASQKIEELNLSLHSKYMTEIHELKIIQDQEGIKKKQLEKSLEMSSKHIANLEEALSKLNSENSGLKKELESTVNNYDRTKSALQQELQSYYQDNNELHEKYERANKDLKELQGQIDKYFKENKDYSFRVEKFVKENRELQGQIDKFSKENKDYSFRVEKVVKENRELQGQIDKYFKENKDTSFKLEKVTKENRELQIQIEQLYRENKELQDEAEKYYMDSREIQGKMEYTFKQSTEYQTKTENLSLEIRDFKAKYENICHEKNDLQLQLEKVLKDYNELRRTYEKITNEKDRISEFMKAEINNVSKQEQEISDLKSQFSISKQANDDFKFQLSKLQQQLAEYTQTIDRQNSEINEWEESYKLLLDDNMILRETVNDLETKNKQLFDNLEKELAQRAKEYKERTIQILNTPNRSTSPYLRPTTPVSHNRDKSDDYGNAAAKLLETMDSPHSLRTSQILPIPGTLKGSTTPTKEDVRTRIASLMRNRLKIEEQMQGLNQE